MMGEDESRRRFMDLLDVDADSCAFGNLPFSDASNWDGNTELYYTGCTGASPPAICSQQNLDLVGLGRPLVRADFGQGVGWQGADRCVIDTLDHSFGACELYSTGTYDLANSTSGGLIRVTRGPNGDPVDEDGP
jgi:hypothetical protein